MRSLATFLVLLAAGTTVSAKCYGSGDSGDKGVANGNLDTVCKAMQGYFKPQQWRTACISKAGQSTYWYFEVKQEGWGGTLTYKDCVEGLKKEVDGCSKGGSTRSGDWNYRSDPGLGSCEDVDFINKHPNGKKRQENASNKDNVSVFFDGKVLAHVEHDSE